MSVSGAGCNGREEAIEGGCQCAGGYGELNKQTPLKIKNTIYVWNVVVTELSQQLIVVFCTKRKTVV